MPQVAARIKPCSGERSLKFSMKSIHPTRRACPHPAQAEFYGYVHDNWAELGVILEDSPLPKFYDNKGKVINVFEVQSRRRQVITDVKEAEKRLDFLRNALREIKERIEELHLSHNYLQKEIEERRKLVPGKADPVLAKLTSDKNRKHCELIGCLKKEEELMAELKKAQRKLYESNITKQTFLLDKKFDEIYQMYETRKERKFKARLKREEMIAGNANAFFKRFEKRFQKEEEQRSKLTINAGKKVVNMQHAMKRVCSFFQRTLIHRRMERELHEKEEALKHARQLKSLQTLKERIDGQREMLRLKERLKWEKAEEKAQREEVFRREMQRVLESEDNPVQRQRKKMEEIQRKKHQKDTIVNKKDVKKVDHPLYPHYKGYSPPTVTAGSAPRPTTFRPASIDNPLKMKPKKNDPSANVMAEAMGQGKESAQSYDMYDYHFVTELDKSPIEDPGETYWVLDFGSVPKKSKSFREIIILNDDEENERMPLKMDIVNPFGPFAQCNAVRELDPGQTLCLKFRFSPRHSKKYEEYITIIGGTKSREEKINLVLSGEGIRVKSGRKKSHKENMVKKDTGAQLKLDEKTPTKIESPKSDKRWKKSRENGPKSSRGEKPVKLHVERIFKSPINKADSTYSMKDPSSRRKPPADILIDLTPTTIFPSEQIKNPNEILPIPELHESKNTLSESRLVQRPKSRNSSRSAKKSQEIQVDASSRSEVLPIISDIM